MTIGVEHLRLVRSLPLFQGLGDAVVYRLLDAAYVRSYSRGRTIFLQGQEADRFFVVLDGWIKLYRQTREGNEAVIEVFGKGESFAEAAMFGNRKFPVSAEAADDSLLMAIPARPFLQHLREDVELMFNMLGSMSMRLKRFVGRTEQVATRTTPQRVAVFLLNFGSTVENTADIRLPYDKFLVAGRLSMKPETFSRALAGLREIGVSTEGSLVHIEDVETLRRFANGS